MWSTGNLRQLEKMFATKSREPLCTVPKAPTNQLNKKAKHNINTDKNVNKNKINVKAEVRT